MHMIDTLGTKLRQLRTEKGLRQDQLAALLGLNKTAISYYENDSHQPSNDVLIRLAGIFNVTTDFLLGCERHDSLDISGLTQADKVIIRDLVENMRSKNKQINSN